ncbi:chromosome transmission fidelity protein 8 homolog [Sycon ciliatum]|uniref:chromosome transmission fidelity protein 8 homolog n=1 Tax=Sycon ciliatum TaxID=27933 RepID=UPI0020AC299E|eukprot:scpid63118/ scgid18462/ Chromosome transmission fidelity protein 8 homolog
MVQIVLRIADDPVEWGLVELQGKLETKDEDEFEGMNIGDLHFDERGTPLLVIGHHLLSGKVVKLERPYAIMDKIVKRTGADGEEVTMVDEDSPSAAASTSLTEGGAGDLDDQSSSTGSSAPATSTEYVISAVIRKKVIFKIRPKPIVRKRVKK